MLAYTYTAPGQFALLEKPKPTLREPTDALVRVTLASICTSDLHIKHGSVPRAVPGITVGHEMVGVVEAVGRDVQTLRPGDRVAVNVETFCGDCFFCRHGWVNNCTHPDGGWALGCRIDGGQAEYVRVPFAEQGLTPIPDGVSDRQALFVGDILATGYWAAEISEIGPEDTVLILGAGPIGVITAQAAKGMGAGSVMITDLMDPRLGLAEKCGVDYCVNPEKEDLGEALKTHFGTDHADIIYDCAGTEATIGQAIRYASAGSRIILVGVYKGWANVNLAALADKELKLYTTLMYRNEDYLDAIGLIDEKKVDLDAMVTGHFPFRQYEEAYHCLKENRESMLKVMIEVGN